MADETVADFWPAPEDTLEPTWWLNAEPGMDDIYDRAGESLDKMVESLKMEIFQGRGDNPRLFLARYEFPTYQADFQHPDAIFIEGEALGFIDFLAGFPVECVEMLGFMGEFSTAPDDYQVKPAEDQPPVAPVPDRFFKGVPEDRIILSVLFLANKSQAMVLTDKGFIQLEGEDKPSKLHWWVRINIRKDARPKFPIPGEFMGLAVRMMPDMPWGQQKSSPFIYSGNWMDTVFLTSARVKEVQDPTDGKFPWSTYKVQWRKDLVEEVRPSDFAEYHVGDRVSILKKVGVDKTSQTWKDDDVKEFDQENWTILPVTYYNDMGKDQ